MFENPRRGRQASKKSYNKCSKNSRSQIVFRTAIFQKLSLSAPEGFAFLSVGTVFIDIVRKVFFSLSPTSQAQLTRNAADNIVRETAYFIKCSWGLSQKLTRYITIHFQVCQNHGYVWTCVLSCRHKSYRKSVNIASMNGEGKRRNEFAEWHVAWLAELHNYAECKIWKMAQRNKLNWKTCARLCRAFF